MTTSPPSDAYTIIHLPPCSTEWAGIIAQFALQVAARDGRSYAAWASERLIRATEAGEGLVALSADGALLGLMIVEVVEQSAEMTLPWVVGGDQQLVCALADAMRQILRERHPTLRFLRVERQLLPGDAHTEGLQRSGFTCEWRSRMRLELREWGGEAALPEGYRLVPWHIRYLDAAAGVVFRANEGTLDAQLYAPFFGESPAQCRRGLLAILVGKFGPLNLQATCCAMVGETLVGVNILIDEGSELSSVVEISVDPAHQRQGVGRALMAQSLTTLRAAHVATVELAVTQANARAVQLYTTLGFTEAGRFPVCIWPADPW
ncbi:MAG TPA: GNAT family N-acetyltransferase [Armatimonadota bacterium]|jgi:ribosomal protein S18 acetylase RimI-like enzyme